MEAIKTYNIYNIKDEKVHSAWRYLGHSIKYLLETNGRPKNKVIGHKDPFGYYNGYIVSFQDMAETYSQRRLDYAPDEFYKGLSGTEVDLSSIVREFLHAVATYLGYKRGYPVRVLFLPFYFEMSFENYFFLEDSHMYFKYVREVLMDKFSYSLEELMEEAIIEC